MVRTRIQSAGLVTCARDFKAAYCFKEEEDKGWGFFAGEEAMILLVQSGLVFMGSLRANPGHLS